MLAFLRGKTKQQQNKIKSTPLWGWTQSSSNMALVGMNQNMRSFIYHSLRQHLHPGKPLTSDANGERALRAVREVVQQTGRKAHPLSNTATYGDLGPSSAQGHLGSKSSLLQHFLEVSSFIWFTVLLVWCFPPPLLEINYCNYATFNGCWFSICRKYLRKCTTTFHLHTWETGRERQTVPELLAVTWMT